MSVERTKDSYYDILYLWPWFSFPRENQQAQTLLSGMGAVQSLKFGKSIESYKNRTDAYFFDLFSRIYVKERA